MKAIHDHSTPVPIREYYTSKLIGVSANSTIREAAQRMTEFGVSSLVVEQDGKVVGFFTDSDLKSRVVAAGLETEKPVSDIMTRNLVTAPADTEVSQALATMARHRIKHLLVTESDQIVGVVTLRDLVDPERQKLETQIARE